MRNFQIFFLNKRWPLCCLLFFIAACQTNKGYDRLVITEKDSLAELQRIKNAFVQIKAVEKTIANGDLVTRTGNDFTSESLRQLNQHDQTYSHCGIASIENDTVFIYHSLGGDWNPDQKIRRDRLEAFAEPYSNRGIGLFRFQLTAAEIDHLITTVKKLHRIGIMFDMKFDLQTNDRMYCAEFVYKSFMMGTTGKLRFNTSHIREFAFVGVDDIFMHPACNEQKRILYK